MPDVDLNFIAEQLKRVLADTSDLKNPHARHREAFGSDPPRHRCTTRRSPRTTPGSDRKTPGDPARSWCLNHQAKSGVTKLDETVSFRKNVTGIDHTLFLTGPYVKVALDPPDSLDPHGATATVALDGTLVAGDVPPELLFCASLKRTVKRYSTIGTTRSTPTSCGSG